MTLNYKSYSIEYDYIYNKSKNCIIFLHGWGGDKNSFRFLFPYLTNYNILTISFPPYFTRDNYRDSNIPLDMNDYSNIVLTLTKLHNIKNASIICHSFGFRIVLMLATTKYNIKSIIATCGAGIDLKKSILKKLKINASIIWHRKLNKKNMQLDINLLKPNDKFTFKNIVNKHLNEYANFINCPTLLFWGKTDKDTPIKCTKILKKKIKNLKEVIVSSNHFAYLNFQNRFTNEVLNFLKEHI